MPRQHKKPDMGDESGHEEKMAREPELDADVHRRILEHINTARRVEDLTERIGHGGHGGVAPTVRRGAHGLDHDQNAAAEMGARGVVTDADIARDILRQRDALSPFGYRHINELREFRWFDKKLLDWWIKLFGPWSWGQWTFTPYSTELPDGTDYHVAHAAMLRTGRVLFLPEADLKTTLLWDPADLVNPQFEFLVDQPDEYLFCSGHSFMSDGRLLVVGGGGGGPSGVNRAWKFDPVAKTWTKTAGDMTHARWYPTVVTLGDERRILIVGGSPSNNTSEVYDEYNDNFTLLTGPSSTRAFPQLYAGLHLLPGGNVFYSRTGFGSAGAGPGGTGDPLNTSAFLQYSAPSTAVWSEIADVPEYPDRMRGMSVILLGSDPLVARVMVIGGTSAPGSQTAETINVSSLTPTWEMAMDVPGGVARNNVNAVLLADGTVFVCGGTTDPAVSCALYNPSTDAWSAMARLNYRKQYHSVAILLPSGQVMATGGSNYGGGSNVIEIFSPPYLFKSAPPQIGAAPAMVHHAQMFVVESAQAADITRITLVRPMAVTHQTDTEQRVIELTFTRSGNQLTVNAPNGPHPHYAPRGYYMLFIINASGTPSEGRFIFLH